MAEAAPLPSWLGPPLAHRNISSGATEFEGSTLRLQRVSFSDGEGWAIRFQGVDLEDSYFDRPSERGSSILVMQCPSCLGS